MKKNITLRAEWVIATLALPQAIKLIVLEAVLAYIVNGYITEIADPQAAEVFATIKADYDASEAKRRERREKAAKRAANKTQTAPAIPGVLPQTPPSDLLQRIENEPFARHARDARKIYPYRHIEPDLAGELALQITDWWRAHPTEEMPSTARLRKEFENRFDCLINDHGDPITRDRWLRKVSPYFPEP